MSSFGPEIDPIYEERKRRWIHQIQSDPTYNAATLQASALALRKFADDLETRKLWSGENLGMDILCTAMMAGAFAGADWLAFRTLLAEGNYLHNVKQLIIDYGPSGWANDDLSKILPTHNAHHLRYIAAQIERFIITPDQSKTVISPPAATPQDLKPTEIPADPIPPDYHEEILEALLHLKAFDRKTRKSTADICKKALGPNADPAILKRPIKRLRELGLVLTKGNRGGGVWLTPKGREVAIEITKR